MSTPEQRPKIAGLWPDLLLGVGFFALYASTLAPGLLPADSGEFQSVVALWGVAHPPGFVPYTLLAGLFARLVPLGSMAWRANLFSAVVTAATLVLVYRAGRHVDRRGLLAWLLAAGLGLSTTVWAQATTANIRSLTALLTAVIVLTWLAFQARPGLRQLSLLSLALALGVLHHASLAFIGVVLGLFALGRLWQVQRTNDPLPWGRVALALASGLLWLPLLLYLPLRAGAWGAPPGIDTWPGFLDHVLARGFGGDLFALAQWALLPERAAILGNIALFQFGWLLLAVLLAGQAWLVVRQRWRGLALVLAAALHAFVAITYRAPQTVEYLMPAYVLLAVGAASLGDWPESWLARRQPAVVAVVLGVVALALVPLVRQNWPAYHALAQDDSTQAHAQAVLNAAPDGAVILAPWHHVTPLWYLTDVGGQRPDLPEPRYVFPQGNTHGEAWRLMVDAAVDDGPVYLTGYFPRELGDLNLAPVGPGWLLDPPPPGNRLNASFEAGWTLLDATPAPATLHPGAPFEVTVYWQRPSGAGPVNVFVQLIGPDGRLYAGADQQVAPQDAAGGEVVGRRLALVVAHNAPPGDYRLVAGAYEPGGGRLLVGDGSDSVTLGTVTVAPRLTPPATAQARLFGPLVGYDYDNTLPASMRLWLHWRLDDAPQTWTLYSGEQEIGSFAVPAGDGFISTAHDLPPDWRNWRLVRADGQRIRLREPQPGDRYVPFGGQIVLTSLTHGAQGNTVRVRTTWRAERPLTVDAVLKQALVGAGYAWVSQVDGIPAGGALPTLKWLPGPVVVDWATHTLLDGQTPAHLDLAVYDNFTQQGYPVGDPRLAELGPLWPWPDAD